ncbi:hypothetical protein [Hoeflea olei]|uniref:Uncharacterized protein n=1 Tax=Hoeflea olei TaxID=1480615 RepID=A0A1C1YQD4_9HYPH|nr:hypothetical protein [Hoeflea olei]OCW55718.1 hypothetical protein AWJ14_14625 [Hoeflea olei]
MRSLPATGVTLAVLMAARPAYALDVDRLLKQAFGSSDPSDLGVPIFVLIAVVAVLFFWGAHRIGKKRQRRMIETYDSQLKEYSTRLRRRK